MTYDVYMHFPVLAIMTLFVGAFLVTLAGKREKLRNVIAGAAVLIALVLLALLIKPVMVDGEIIVYWMGNWEPVSGYAIGIAIEVDALSLFFGLLVAIAVACSCFYSYRYMKQDDARGGYFTLYLMLAGGVMGIVLSEILLIPGNIIIQKVSGTSTLVASLPVNAALFLVALATLLTILAGIIPARGAAKSNPVKALRSE